MNRLQKTLFALEVLFLGLVLILGVQDGQVIGYYWKLLGVDFSVLVGDGTTVASISTSVLGLLFALAFNLSLGNEKKPVSMVIAGLALGVWIFNFVKLFVSIAVMITFELGLVILVIDALNFTRLSKTPEAQQ